MITKEIKKCLETEDNKNTMIQNLWDTVKAVLRGMFIAIHSYLKKQSEINKLTLHLKKQKPQVSRRKEIIVIRAEINEIDKENNRKDQ